MNDWKSDTESGLSSCVRRLISAAVLTAIALVTHAGCAVHLHNAENAKTAREAADAFRAADVQSYVAAERKIALATQERDLEVTRRNVMGIRDAFLVAALDPERSAETIRREFVDKRLNSLGVPPDAGTRRRLQDLKDQRIAAIAIRDQCLLFARSASEKISPPSFPPSAADEDAISKSNDPTLKRVCEQYFRNSKEYLENLRGLARLDGDTKIGNINARLIAARDLESQVTASVKPLKEDLRTAVKNYEEVAEGGTRPAEALKRYSEEIEKALKSFDDAQKPLQSVAATLGLQDLLARIPLEKLKEQRGQIGRFMSGLSDFEAGAPGATAGSAELAGRVAAVVAQSATAISESSARAQLVPLTFEQERLRIEIDRLQRMVDRGNARIALLERQRDAYVDEAEKLIDADNSLQRASGGDERAGLGALASADNQSALHAIFIVSTSIAVNRLQEEQAEVMLIGLDHDQALDASEFSLRLWEHTIAAPMEQLVAYHESGITTDDIAKLLQAASLAGVAVGVNR